MRKPYFWAHVHEYMQCVAHTACAEYVFNMRDFHDNLRLATTILQDFQVFP